MQIIEGTEEILQDFRAVKDNFERDSRQIPKKLQDAWVFMVHLTDAIDSGDYLRAIGWHPQSSAGDLQQFLVDTSDNKNVDYEGFVEGGTTFIAARFPAQKAIERGEFVSSIAAMVEGGFKGR